MEDDLPDRIAEAVMMHVKNTFASFSVADAEATSKFYTDVLGLKVEPESNPEAAGAGVLWIRGPGEQAAMAYLKPDHTPANFTVFNLEVDDIDEAIADLSARGATFERYEEMNPDERGVVHMGGVAGAWVKDPSGNVVAVMQREG